MTNERMMDNPSPRIERPAGAAAPSAAAGPGSVIAGKYRLESLLGEGGMGTVWLARNETLDAPVALKLMRSGMQRAETVTRLLREAHVEARLKHPNIVRVFDCGIAEHGDPFIVMEVLEGISLGELLQERGQLGRVEAVRLLLPVIGALCHAHENGVVHRDLKPHNIFLDRGGLHAGTKLLDFGVAKLVGDLDRHFTPGGRLLGSPAYMAPEQAEGSEDVDHRVDIWAICIVLYESIAGAPPFPGEGYAVLRKVVEDELPPLEGSEPGDQRLWQLLRRGLSKEPANRHQSMRELGTALAQWLCDQGESEDLDGNRISRRWNVTAQGDAASDLPPDLPASTAAPPTLRPRRFVQMHDSSVQTTKNFARSLRPFAVRRRASTARWLVGAALAVAFLVLAPSRLGDHAPRVAQAEPQPMTARADVDRLLPPTVSPPEPSAPQVPLATPPPVPPSRDSSPPRRMSQRITERALGLKDPY